MYENNMSRSLNLEVFIPTALTTYMESNGRMVVNIKVEGM